MGRKAQSMQSFGFHDSPPPRLRTLPNDRLAALKKEALDCMSSHTWSVSFWETSRGAVGGSFRNNAMGTWVAVSEAMP